MILIKLINNLKNLFSDNFYEGLDELDIKMEEYILDFIKSKKGFFIECGANDGISQSNTYFLEKKYGWNGLLIEPIPKLFEKCKITRSNDNYYENCALVDNNYSEKYVEINYCNLMSVLNLQNNNDLSYNIDQHVKSGNRFLEKNDELKNKTIKVPASTLQSILDKYKITEIDIFSLDVEGFESFVIDGIDFNKTKINYLLVECRDFDNLWNKLYDKGFKSFIKLSSQDFLVSAKNDLTINS